MRRALLACAVLAASLLAGGVSAARREHIGALNHRLTEAEHTAAAQSIQPQYLTQKLDHHNADSTATFQQLYYLNDTFWNPQAPVIFLMIGGEGPLSPAYVTDHFNTGPLSAQYGAMQVALEHRFYGQSVPNNDSSTANLQYLSSEQALEDLVTLHAHLTTTYAVKAQYIVFGGSYSGAMSAWARLKYPHLFSGSIASSGPVQAVLDFDRYFDVVAASVGPTCAAVIQQSTNVVTQMLATADGLAKLAQAFNTCAPIGADDVANFISTLSDPIAETVQYNDDANRRAFDIPFMCGILESQPDALTALIQLWFAYLNHTGAQGQCTDVSYASYIESMQSSSAGRSWTWQTCTEFGYFQTGEDSSQPFSPLISLEYFVQQCSDIFGVPGLTPNIQATLDEYGGNQIVSSNTVYTNGDIDPWHALGNYQNYSTAFMSKSILMHGTAHCADLYAPDPADLPELTAARATQEGFITQWLVTGPTAAAHPHAQHKPKSAASSSPKTGNYPCTGTLAGQTFDFTSLSTQNFYARDDANGWNYSFRVCGGPVLNKPSCTGQATNVAACQQGDNGNFNDLGDSVQYYGHLNLNFMDPNNPKQGVTFLLQGGGTCSAEAPGPDSPWYSSVNLVCAEEQGPLSVVWAGSQYAPCVYNFSIPTPLGCPTSFAESIVLV